MDTYEFISLLFLGGLFLIALRFQFIGLACIDRNNKQKNKPTLLLDRYR